MAKPNGHYQKLWRARPENIISERLRTHDRWKNDPRVRARRAVQVAKHMGQIEKGRCVVCGTEKDIENHHPDYSNRYYIIPLCRKHHEIFHAVFREDIAKRQQLGQQPAKGGAG